MKGARIKSVMAEMLTIEARKLRKSGGRMQFAYAWTPHGGDSEIRYATALPGQPEFEIWVLKSADIVPSLAQIWPLVSWYEREMADLNGIQFANHPEPYPLVLRDGASIRENGVDFLQHPPMNGGHHLPTIEAKDVQRLPFGPIRADVFESAEFTFFYVGEHIIHYQPQLFFKHRGMEKCFEGRSPNQECRRGRAGLRGWNRCTCARLLRGRGARRGLRGAGSRPSASRSPGGVGTSLQPSPLPWASLPYDNAQGRRSPGQAARGAGQAIERAADRKPLSAKPARPRRLAPRSRPRQVAWRSVGILASGIRRLRRPPRSVRKPPRSPHHHRPAAEARCVRPRRDRPCGTRLRPRSRPAPRPSLCALRGACCARPDVPGGRRLCA